MLPSVQYLRHLHLQGLSVLAPVASSDLWHPRAWPWCRSSSDLTLVLPSSCNIQALSDVVEQQLWW